MHALNSKASRWKKKTRLLWIGQLKVTFGFPDGYKILRLPLMSGDRCFVCSKVVFPSPCLERKSIQAGAKGQNPLIILKEALADVQWLSETNQPKPQRAMRCCRNSSRPERRHLCGVLALLDPGRAAVQPQPIGLLQTREQQTVRRTQLV